MILLLLGIAVVLGDQLTKEWIRGAYPLHEAHAVVPGFFDLTHVQNTGAAWGMFSGNSLALAGVALIALAALMVFRRRIFTPGWGGSVVAGLLLGGIVGNLLDRVRLGYVTDFLDFYHGTWHFPAFNVADAAITAACILHVLFTFLQSLKAAETKSGPAPEPDAAPAETTETQGESEP